MKARLTQDMVDATDRPEDGNDKYIGDELVSGLRLKITGAGKRVLFFQYRSPVDGRQRKKTYKTSSLDEARRWARGDLSEVSRNHKDPQALDDARKSSPTVAEAVEIYVADRLDREKIKPGTAAEYSRIGKATLPSWLSRMRVTDVEQKDIAKMVREMRNRKATANAAVRVLSAVFEWSLGDGGLMSGNINPCSRVDLYPSVKRHCTLTDAELLRLGAVLDEAEVSHWPPAIDAIRLLLFTGMRRDEVLDLTWAEVDLQAKMIRLKDAKTGKRDVPLGGAAVAILEKLARFRETFGSAYVIPSPRDRTQRLVGLPKIWRKLRERAAIPDVRIHDLRHNYGGHGAAVTRSAVHVKGLLGHTQITTTDRYMKLAEAPLHTAADEVNEALAAKLKPANVVAIGGRK